MKQKLLFSVALLCFCLAEAQITYQDISPDFSTTMDPVTEIADNLMPIDLNNDGTREFYFRWDDMEVFGNESWFVHFCSTPVSDPNRQFITISGNYHSPLVYGTPINASSTWTSNWDPTIGDSFNGNFQGLGNRYLAFKAVISGTTYYGWVLVTLVNKTLTIKEYAYTTNAGGLTAGQGALNVAENVKGNLILSPNPALSEITVSVDGNQNTPFRYQILDLTGKKVTEGMACYGDPISVGDIAGGSYLIQIETNGVVHTHRIIKK
ncbi:T9SS type A sorting domain-containing protein [Flavobacterium sp. TBRC 19031]|uniref:T9SS type A sorting domain-containing protein n=1 Tax=Flavobacterium mekongense TaxID=3379707 RepID=UPI0039999817